MKFLKKAVSILAACGIAIAAIPFSAIPADAAILYSLDDGVLTIKSPEVIEKDGTKVPWYDERDQITSLVLRDGITEIGDALFTDLTALETIDFPEDNMLKKKKIISYDDAHAAIMVNAQNQKMAEKFISYLEQLNHINNAN